MALNYANFRLLAERLIGENGRAMTLVRRDQGNPADPLKPWRDSTGADDISLAVVGVFVEYEKDDIDGTLVMAADKRILVAATDATAIEDFNAVVDGAVIYRIVKAGVIEPGDTRILYDIQARQ